MADAAAESCKEAILAKDAEILKVHMKYFKPDQIEHLEKVRDLVFAIRCASVTTKDDVVKVLSSDEPESVETRKQRDVVEPVDDDSIDTPMTTQEIFFIYPDCDTHVREFKKAWDQWKEIDKRTDPGRYAPT